MAELKILCTNRKACPDVMEKLQSLGFKHILEIDSPSFDIVAKFDKSMDQNSVDGKVIRLIQKNDQSLKLSR